MINPNQKIVDSLLDKATNSVKTTVSSILGIYSGIKWKRVSFTIPMVPEPSHRPRLCGYRVYVPGAAKHQSFFNRNVRPKLNGLYIDTPCRVKAMIYCKTPSSFTKTQTILAEMGVIRPWGNIGDVDNFAKAIYDMMQPNEKRGHVGIMANDSLIIDSVVNKYYSTNPRYEVTIEYMVKIPDELRKVFKLDK